MADFYEVEWTTTIPVDANGDAILDAAVNERAIFPTEQEARAYALTVPDWWGTPRLRHLRQITLAQYLANLDEGDEVVWSQRTEGKAPTYWMQVGDTENLEQ